MKSVIMLSLLFLTGCIATPVKRNFPDAPPSLTTACESLTVAPMTNKLSIIISSVTTNYGKYHECSYKVDAWNNWYVEQKKIFDSVK
jgi:hypothetical protein